MPENNAAVVDSAEAKAVVDSAAENMEVNPSMEGSSPKGKTYTEAEHDAIVKQRIDKQNAKHTAEVNAISKELEALRAENDSFKAKAALEEARMAVADEYKEYGVTVETLDGATEAEIRAQARACAAMSASMPKYGPYKDSGEPSGQKLQSSDKTAFVRNLFSNE